MLHSCFADPSEVSTEVAMMMQLVVEVVVMVRMKLKLKFEKSTRGEWVGFSHDSRAAGPARKADSRMAGRLPKADSRPASHLFFRRLPHHHHLPPFHSNIIVTSLSARVHHRNCITTHLPSTSCSEADSCCVCRLSKPTYVQRVDFHLPAT